MSDPGLVRAAILAGGAATRYGGEPKGLTRVGGRRILDRVVDACLEAVGALPALIANHPDAPTWRPDLRVIPDRRPGTGTLGGLFTAVADAPAPVVCVAWDMPFVSAPLLRRLAQELDYADVVLPQSAGPLGIEPLCAGYGPGCRLAMIAALGRGDYRAVGFHPEVRVRVVSDAEVRRFGDPRALFFNVNTPADRLHAETLASS